LEGKSKVEINMKFKTRWLLYVLYLRFDNVKPYHLPLNYLVRLLSKNSDYFPTHRQSARRVFTVR